MDSIGIPNILLRWFLNSTTDHVIQHFFFEFRNLLSLWHPKEVIKGLLTTIIQACGTDTLQSLKRFPEFHNGGMDLGCHTGMIVPKRNPATWDAYQTPSQIVR